MSISITESGMTFGRFAPNDVFEFEKVLTELKFGDHVSKVEFIVRYGLGSAAVVFVEAKRSVPRQSDVFFAEVRLKMIHALTVWFTAVCGRHEQLLKVIPDNLNKVEHLKLPLKMYLVIPEAPDSMLPQLSDKFRQSLSAEQKIWAIRYSDISVLNESRAKKQGLVGRNDEGDNRRNV